MRRALGYLSLALLFIAIVPSKAQTEPAATIAPLTTTLPFVEELVPPVEGSPSQPGALQRYDLPRNVSFSCNIDNPSNETFVWEKNNTDISKVPELTGRYKLEDSNARLAIHRTNEEDVGNYTCKLGDRQLHWELKARPYTKLPSFDSSVVEGKKLKLVCRVIGKPAVPVEWWYQADAANYDENNNRGVQLAPTDRIKLETSEAGVENGQLVIEAATMADAGAYACLPVVDSDMRSPHINAFTELRVKPYYYSILETINAMYAALWPVLGVCALLACAAVLVRARRRRRGARGRDDTDAPTTNVLPNQSTRLSQVQEATTLI